MCLLHSHFPEVFIEITSSSSILFQIYTIPNLYRVQYTCSNPFFPHRTFLDNSSIYRLLFSHILSHKKSFIAPQLINFYHFFSSTKLRTKAIHFPPLIPSSSLSNLPKAKVKSLSHVRLFATPWTVAYQAPPSMGFSRQEYWSGLPFPSPGDLPDPGIKPRSPALQADTLPSEPSGKHR